MIGSPRSVNLARLIFRQIRAVVEPVDDRVCVRTAHAAGSRIHVANAGRKGFAALASCTSAPMPRALATSPTSPTLRIRGTRPLAVGTACAGGDAYGGDLLPGRNGHRIGAHIGEAFRRYAPEVSPWTASGVRSAERARSLQAPQTVLSPTEPVRRSRGQRPDLPPFP